MASELQGLEAPTIWLALSASGTHWSLEGHWCPPMPEGTSQLSGTPGLGRSSPLICAPSPQCALAIWWMHLTVQDFNELLRLEAPISRLKLPATGAPGTQLAKWHCRGSLGSWAPPPLTIGCCWDLIYDPTIMPPAIHYILNFPYWFNALILDYVPCLIDLSRNESKRQDV